MTLRSRPAVKIAPPDKHCLKEPVQRGWNECHYCEALWPDSMPPNWRPSNCYERTATADGELTREPQK